MLLYLAYIWQLPHVTNKFCLSVQPDVSVRPLKALDLGLRPLVQAVAAGAVCMQAQSRACMTPLARRVMGQAVLGAATTVVTS